MASKVSILGVGVDNLTRQQALERIEGFLQAGGSHQVVTVNPELVIMAQEDGELKRLINGAHLALADGVGLLWAARLHGTPLKERVAGVDMVEDLSRLAAAHSYSIYLLGAGEGVAQGAARVLQERYPGLQVVGTYAGSSAPQDEEDIIGRVRAASPAILFVAYGAPRQELWISRNLARLGVPVCMGVGGAFDFISGRVRRAPGWVRRLGLEWLFRLLRQPWRWRRMLRLPRFAGMVLRERLWKL
jgi:N-acetylglucosaminyldiphosphoundecaprenol N-acetyl-beta-D-mannosaminyltransferase